MKAHIGEKTKSVATVTNHLQKNASLRDHLKESLGIHNFIVANVISLFLKKEILIHMAIHTGKKPDPCTKCGKAFSQKVILKYHMTIHCDKFFLEK